MATYQTPGVFVEEISTLPPSVAEVATAVPAFIGYTKIGSGTAASPVTKRISSMLEFMTEFGAAFPAQFEVTPASATAPLSVSGPTNTHQFSLYYALDHYFKNGGGPCYVVAVGNYQATPSAADFSAGIQALEQEDEPTLIVLTDAACLLSAADYYQLCSEAMMQCKKLGDRFTILDVLPSAVEGQQDWQVFRDDANLSSNLDYAAAYTPYLQSTLTYLYAEEDVQVAIAGEVDSETGATSNTNVTMASLVKAADGTPAPSPQTELYNQVKTALSQRRIILPPSAAIAGVYARTDREQGVWKAPANAGLTSVLGPVTKITDGQQELLNVDPTAGKSINAIRAFAGKGTLVWGARTLAGNDNEWRYVPVRRLFITIEESTKKASAFAVFEPNNQSTWLKIKAMIESYLYGLWQRGALAGSSPETAYFVKVGLGSTMTEQDVLEGRILVEIGIAAVRPAEFIVLKFSHKQQTA